jgi:hypothetical protein
MVQTDGHSTVDSALQDMVFNRFVFGDNHGFKGISERLDTLFGAKVKSMNSSAEAKLICVVWFWARFDLVP